MFKKNTEIMQGFSSLGNTVIGSMTFILTFSLLSVLVLIGLVLYLCPPTSSARSRCFIAQQEEWLYFRRLSLPKEMLLLNFELFRIGGLAEGQHALMIENETTPKSLLFDYITVDDLFAKQTVIVVRSQSLDSFILRALPQENFSRTKDAMIAEKSQTLEYLSTAIQGYRIETNQAFRTKNCIESLEQFLRIHPGICIEFVGNTLLLYKPNTCLGQEQLDQALKVSRRLFSTLSHA